MIHLCTFKFTFQHIIPAVQSAIKWQCIIMIMPMRIIDIWQLPLILQVLLVIRIDNVPLSLE